MSEPITKLTAANLAALLCARICHDLVSPIGALGAALEVFDDDDNLDMRDDAIELIKLSAGQASAKLQFLRLAFGAGGSAPSVIASEELERLTRGVYGQGKVKIHWQIETDGVDKTAARILLNLIMLAVMSIPRGGTMTITNAQNSEQMRLNIVCEGTKARLDSTTVATLKGNAPGEGFDGRSIQPFYTGMITRECGGTITTSIVEEIVTFSAILPIKGA